MMVIKVKERRGSDRKRFERETKADAAPTMYLSDNMSE
jgi:hypothetical protein